MKTIRIILTASIAATLALAGNIYSTGFEASEGFVLGELGGQQGWYNTTGLTVQNSVVHSGSQAVGMNSGVGQSLMAYDFSYNSIGNPNQVVTLQTWFRQETGTGSHGWNVFAVFSESAFIGQIRVVNGVASLGLGSGTAGAVPIADGVWYDFRFIFDFGTRTKTAMVGSTLIATLPFGAPGDQLATVAIGRNFGATGNTNNRAYWDDLSIVSSPEPGTLGLALAAIGVIAVRFHGVRRRRGD